MLVTSVGEPEYLLNGIPGGLSQGHWARVPRDTHLAKRRPAGPSGAQAGPRGLQLPGAGWERPDQQGGGRRHCVRLRGRVGSRRGWGFCGGRGGGAMRPQGPAQAALRLQQSFSGCERHTGHRVGGRRPRQGREGGRTGPRFKLQPVAQ